jgi:hypothetical protein
MSCEPVIVGRGGVARLIGTVDVSMTPPERRHHVFEGLNDFIDTLQGHVDVLPQPLQIAAVLLIGMIPFLEGDVSAAIGIAAGVPLLPTILAATIGTILVTIGAVALGARTRAIGRRGGRDERILSRAQRFGVPLAMLVGGFLVSVPLNAFVMSAARLNRTAILVSGIVVAALNTVFVALVAAGVLAVLTS